VNDMAEVNIDAELVRGSHPGPHKTDVVELTNGCICCTLRDDLLLEVAALVVKGDFDYLIIESTGQWGTSPPSQPRPPAIIVVWEIAWMFFNPWKVVDGTQAWLFGCRRHLFRRSGQFSSFFFLFFFPPPPPTLCSIVGLVAASWLLRCGMSVLVPKTCWPHRF
jgi:CobW/HypB/UreG, nucleotide-binding domain